MYFLSLFSVSIVTCTWRMVVLVVGAGRVHEVFSFLNILTKLFLLSEIVWMTGVGSHVNC